MIKVLLIDDEPSGIQSAKAGLIPLPDHPNKDLDIQYRQKLADSVFEIERVEDIQSAIQQIKSFKPDLAIIDINLKDDNPVIIEGRELRNGIDLYRYIDALGKHNPVVKVLFSNHGATHVYMNQFAKEEEIRKHFISKAEGVGVGGYEILAARISGYLKEVSLYLVSKMGTETKQECVRLLQTQDWETLKTFKINHTSLRFQDLCIFDSYPVLKNKTPQLVFRNPEIELLNLIQRQAEFLAPVHNRSEWNTDTMQNMMLYLRTNKEMLYPKISHIAEYIITSLIDNITKKPHQRLNSVIEYRLITYIKDKATSFNGHFTKKFINALAIRRVLMFFEYFIRENIDTDLLALEDDHWQSFFNAMPTEILISFRKIDQDLMTRDYTTAGISFNIGFNRPRGKSKKREEVKIDDYTHYDFETEWLNSPKYHELCALLKQAVKNS
ncbi:hypothetical protein CHRY9390_01586 [Chryseobacterium aquaeductus]|uniref:Response regulatory domain-containing protein n=1 Tax=Chryseobacterium aquaeductus TaxID=2675056 RepID=A0A9N8MN53_9FLAO|nr:response regulator [Chryseobacterium aquaeductus]CAA7330907.1 hypothetical protein CHRY9390_01586 [Chryseobacterium potabilaquae]CAD7806927.1 hypothetical protein CHRY9390_01586 [Chryseobacterium aquaeductus]